MDIEEFDAKFGCPYCHEELSMCICDELEIEFESDGSDEIAACSCPDCMCHSPTPYGGTCNNCKAGIHQG